MGEQIDAKPPYTVDTFENVEYLDGGFHGTASEDWPQEEPEPKSEHEIILSTNSALHTAAPIVAAALRSTTHTFANQTEVDEWVKKRLKRWTKICREVAEEMVEEAIKEQEHDEQG